jgi:hypothetical protein
MSSKYNNVTNTALILFLGMCFSFSTYSQKIYIEKKWKKVELPIFSFSIPPEMTVESSMNEDSAI